MRRRLAVPVAVAVLVVITGCGSSSDSGSAGAAPSAAASEAPLTAAEAHKIAVASQVQAADLPGFAEDKSAAGNADAPDAATEKELAACISGGEDTKDLADVTSSDFSRGTVPAQLQVSTEATVVATRKQGEQELAVLQKPSTDACLNAALKKGVSAEAEGGTLEGELKRVTSSEDYGSDGAVRYLFDGALKAQGITIKMRIDLDMLLVDRVELTLSQFAIGEQPLSTADRDRVLKTVVERARAAQNA